MADKRHHWVFDSKLMNLSTYLEGIGALGWEVTHVFHNLAGAGQDTLSVVAFTSVLGTGEAAPGSSDWPPASSNAGPHQ
jgi:hypothetical protein